MEDENTIEQSRLSQCDRTQTRIEEIQGNTEEAKSPNAKPHYSNLYIFIDYILQLHAVRRRQPFNNAVTIQHAQTCRLSESIPEISL
jgi:hypothetical protein